MLIIAGTITFDPAHTDTLVPAVAAMVAATLQEEGCQDYNFSIDPTDPSTVRVFEIWDSQEHLDAHFQTPHMAAFQQAIANVGLSGRNLAKYQISSSEPL